MSFEPRWIAVGRFDETFNLFNDNLLSQLSRYGNFRLPIEDLTICHHLFLVDLSSNVAQVQHFIVGDQGQQREIDYSLEGELEENVEDNARCHDTDDIATAKLEHLVELDEEAVGQLTVDQLDHERGDQSRLKGEFTEHSEDSTTHECLSKCEPTRKEDK